MENDKDFKAVQGKTPSFKSSQMEYRLPISPRFIEQDKPLFSCHFNTPCLFSLVDITVNGLKYDSVPQTVPPQGELYSVFMSA